METRLINRKDSRKIFMMYAPVIGEIKRKIDCPISVNGRRTETCFQIGYNMLELDNVLLSKVSIVFELDLKTA